MEQGSASHQTVARLGHPWYQDLPGVPKDAKWLSLWLEALAAVVIVTAGALCYFATHPGPKAAGADSFFHALGPEICAGGVVALFVVLVVGRGRSKIETEDRSFTVHHLTALLQGEGVIHETLEMREAIRDLGIVGWSPTRPTDVIVAAVKRARQRIEILEVSVDSLRGRLTRSDWQDIASRTVNCRVLLIDPTHEPEPNFYLALQRDVEEGQYWGAILQEVRQFLNSDCPPEWLAEGAQPIIKLTHTMPTLSIFRADDRAWVSVFIHGRPCDSTGHLELASNGQLFRDLVLAHFDALWKDPNFSVIPPDLTTLAQFMYDDKARPRRRT